MGEWDKNSDRLLTVSFLYHFPNWNKPERSEIIANSAKHQSPRRPSVIVDLDRRSWYTRTARCRFHKFRRVNYASKSAPEHGGSRYAHRCAGVGVTAARKPASPVADLPSGKVQLMSAGALAFGPDGILFVGDSVGGAVVAIDTGDTKAIRHDQRPGRGRENRGAGGRDAGSDHDQRREGEPHFEERVSVRVSRPRPGCDAADRARGCGGQDHQRFRSTTPSTLRSAWSMRRSRIPTARQNPRMQTITDMNYVNGNLMVAGLSNEEWSSALRSIPFPFKEAAKGATLQIWHSSHGRYETAAPVRTFVPYTISGQQYILAAYTCTPLVKIPVSELKPGAKVKGVEIADLGAGNQPLDMVPYKKDGHELHLIANTSRGVMKLKADNLETYPSRSIRRRANPTRCGRRSLRHDERPQDVQHLTQLDDSNAVIITGKPGPVSPVLPDRPPDRSICRRLRCPK